MRGWFNDTFQLKTNLDRLKERESRRSRNDEGHFLSLPPRLLIVKDEQEHKKKNFLLFNSWMGAADAHC